MKTETKQVSRDGGTQESIETGNTATKEQPQSQRIETEGLEIRVVETLKPLKKAYLTLMENALVPPRSDHVGGDSYHPHPLLCDRHLWGPGSAVVS